MSATPPAQTGATPNGIAERLVQATITLLAQQGPSAVKARSVAAEAGMSTMVVYNYFGGIPELVQAAVDHGFNQLERAFDELQHTDDPVADLFSMALRTVDIARANPHLYDAMFGLSTRATYRPVAEPDRKLAGRSPAFRAAYAHITHACTRLASCGRVSVGDPAATAGALWSFVHGYIALELAGHFTDHTDPIAEVLAPMAATFAIGMGDDPADARRSHATALARHRNQPH